MIAVALMAATAGTYFSVQAALGVPVVGVLAVADLDVRVNDEPATTGAELVEGARIHVVKGDAIVLLKGNRSVVLREGSALQLGPSGASVTLARGRARFEVTRVGDQPNPFRVHAGAAAIDVLGTVFAVERSTSDERVLVAVKEGRVRVSTAKAETFIGGGEEATVVGERVSRLRPASASSLREDGNEKSFLERLRQRAGKLFHDWTP